MLLIMPAQHQMGAGTKIPGGHVEKRDTPWARLLRGSGLALLAICGCFVLAGCGAAGYAGGGISTISDQSLVLDSGQSMPITATESSNLSIAWSFAGSGCSASACGSLSSNSGSTVTYTAPTGNGAPIHLSLLASIPGTESEATVNITVNPDPSLQGVAPQGTVGVPYSTTITAAGGTSPLKMSLASGALPAGLSMDPSTGIVSGTPTVAGTSTFMVQLVDSSMKPYKVSSNQSITIVNPIASLGLTGGVQPQGEVSIPYTTSLSATGGVAPYAWSVVGGALPAGLTISPASGAISGTPTAQGNFNFTVQVADAANNVATAQASIAVNSLLTLAGGQQPEGAVGQAYTTSLTAAGGTLPYTWSIASGSLPPALTISATTGVISGTPTTKGTFSFTVSVKDDFGATATVATAIAVDAPLALTSVLPNGTVGQAYVAAITASGGTSPYSCSVTGALPAGLSLSGCAISGTPTVAGSSIVDVKVTDSSTPMQTVSANQTIVIAPAPLALTSSLPNGTVGSPYSSTITATGGTSPYSCSIAGTLPTGLSLSGCTVAGTPTAIGSTTVNVKVTDSGSPAQTASANQTILIAPSTLVLTSSLPNGMVGAAYSATITAAGGTTPYTCSVTGALPANLTLSGCAISGTPTATGSSTVNVKVTDSGSPAQTVNANQTIVIAPSTLALTNTLPGGTVGVAYSATITASGGTSPYTCSISGTLPANLTLNGCTLSGTPSASGNSPVTVTVTDSGSPAQTASANETISIAPATLTVTNPPLPNGVVGVAYSATIAATGGVSPYSCSITGSLPAGLSLTGCTVSGNPTTAGTSSITVHVTDSGSTPQNASQADNLVIAPATLTVTSTLPGGTIGVAYSATITAADGTPPYTCSITGTLPAGLTLSGCTLSGTPTTAGSSPLVVKVTDSGSPAQNATSNQTVTIVPATLTVTGTLPNGTVGSSYSGAITASGGTQPYTCSITGTLPAGLVLTGCIVSGTPTASGSSTFTVKVTDSGNPAQNASANETVVINPATLTVTGTLPNGTVGGSYSGAITATGGTQPYTCSITGTLPAGLVLNGCTVSGTPTASGSSTFTVKVTDSGSPAQTASANDTVVINPAPLALTNSSLPDGTVGVAYSTTIGVSGGTAPYSCSIQSGSLPAGLSLSGCTITGTPTTIGSSTLTVKVTDSGNPTESTTGTETLVIDPAALTLTGSLPNGTVGIAYSATIGASGGTTPYSCTIAGALPVGLSLSACTVSGTPTTAGSYPVTVHVSDASTPVKTASATETIVINPAGTLSLTATLPTATVGVAYSYSFQATGGLTPYTYAVTAGSLPAGLTLQTNGTLAGTPTTVGASSFTITVTDSQSPAATASLPIVLSVQYAPTPYDGELTGPYAYLFQGYDDVASGVLAYQTATVGSFTADGSGGIQKGELDANHQTSNPTGGTIESQNFVGTYQVNSDNRGMVTITTLNTDGTTDATFTYAISLLPPVSPSTTSAQGSLIEFDNNQAVGTKGSGTLLAQTTSTFAAGLNGSYAFGLSGDTPCLVSCGLGVETGPVATAGQFVANGSGTLSSGAADANIATANFANEPLTGSYQTADQNGRVALVMTNTGISDGIYPTNFVAYIVNANEALLLSTNKHSDYILLAGTAQLQTQGTFSNSSLNGPIVGYENAQSNPGLLGATLQDVLGYSTATIFRASSNGAGTCSTTNVDTGGMTSLIDNLTGLSGLTKSNLLTALLGSYQATGSSTCTVSSNGRGTLNYPQPPLSISTLLGLLGLPTGAPAPRVFYLVSPGSGYFIETGYAGLGQFAQQTGAPFSLATLDGTYVEQTVPASSLASIDASGYFTANGSGQANYTTDENVGVGTDNILQLGATGSTTYSLSDPNNIVPAATAGRYLLGDGTTVIYAISPSEFVMVDTSALTTSPGITLLY